MKEKQIDFISQLSILTSLANLVNVTNVTNDLLFAATNN